MPPTYYHHHSYHTSHSFPEWQTPKHEPRFPPFQHWPTPQSCYSTSQPSYSTYSPFHQSPSQPQAYYPPCQKNEGSQ
ncbi:hypothetical protein Lalb_Chr02g0156291 [Lupinus albus]|uniref:Uncharacterized protein n=1 Tax=Lupinus albus TaxID=3870 RepID=A0A6A4R294_LUPAL|nr:hypothetical protein Lalb_Chr02g0156291 [Lupinus albus]